jgi:uncharacterized protein YtpQ (UPF0354 family)
MNIFKKIFSSSRKKEEITDKHIKKTDYESEGYVNLGKSIYPVLRDKNDAKFSISENINPIIKDNFIEGVVICYILDIGDNFELISENHLKQFNLTKDDVKNVAYRNLINQINGNINIKVEDYRDKNPEMRPFFSVEFNSNLNPSIMLLDEFWETNAKEITKSDILAVSMPAKNLFYFTTLEDIVSFDTMTYFGNVLYEASLEDNLHLTQNTYVRKNGKWILCDKTDEQVEELLEK